MNNDIINIDTNNHYSTSETWTGKYWIDRKKIYRKVCEVTIPSSGNGAGGDHGISNLSTVINVFGMTSPNVADSNIRRPLNNSNYAALAWNCCIYCTDTRLGLQFGDTFRTTYAGKNAGLQSNTPKQPKRKLYINT